MRNVFCTGILYYIASCENMGESWEGVFWSYENQCAVTGRRDTTMNSIQTLKTSLTYAVARVRVRGPLARIEREVNEHRFAAVHHRRANHRYQQRH